MVRRSSAMSRYYFALDSLVPGISSAHAQIFPLALIIKKKTRGLSSWRRKLLCHGDVNLREHLAYLNGATIKYIALFKDAFSFAPPAFFSF